MKRIFSLMLVLVFAFTMVTFNTVFAADVEIVNVFGQNNHDITEPVKLTVKLATAPSAVKLTIGGYEYEAECTPSELRGEGYYVVSATLTDGKMPPFGLNEIELDVDGVKANTTIHLDKFVAQTDADTIRNTSFEGLDGKTLSEIGSAIYKYYGLTGGGVQNGRYVYSNSENASYTSDSNRLSFYIYEKANPQWWRVPYDANKYSPEEISVSLNVKMETNADGFRLDAHQYENEKLMIYKPNSTSWSWGIEIANDGKFADGTAVTLGKDYAIEVKYNRSSKTYEVFADEEKLFGGNFSWYNCPGERFYAFGLMADAPGEISFDNIVVKTTKSYPEPIGLKYRIGTTDTDVVDGGMVNMAASSIVIPMSMDSGYEFTDYENNVTLTRDNATVSAEVAVDGTSLVVTPQDGFSGGDYRVVLGENLKFGSTGSAGTAYGAKTYVDFSVESEFALITPSADIEAIAGESISVYGTLPSGETATATLDGVNVPLDTTTKPGYFSASINTLSMSLGEKLLTVTNGTDTYEINLNIKKYVKEKIYFDMSTFDSSSLKQYKQNLGFMIWGVNNEKGSNSASRTNVYGDTYTVTYTPTGSGSDLNNTNMNGIGGIQLDNTDGGTGTRKDNGTWYDRKVIWSFDASLPTEGYGLLVAAHFKWTVAVSAANAVAGKVYKVELVEDYTGSQGVQSLYVDGVKVGQTYNITKPTTCSYESYRVCAYKATAAWSQAEIDAGAAIPVLTLDNIKYGFYEEAPMVDEDATGKILPGTSPLSFNLGKLKFDKESVEAAAELWVDDVKLNAAASYDAETNVLTMTPLANLAETKNAKLVIKSTAVTALSATAVGSDIEYKFTIGDKNKNYITLNAKADGADFYIATGNETGFKGYAVLAGYTAEGDELETLSFVPVNLAKGESFEKSYTSASVKVKAFIWDKDYNPVKFLDIK